MNKPNDTKPRCAWAGEHPPMLRYHDEEWGVPLHDDRLLFEFLILEGAQAGLTWRTILDRRQNYRRAFEHFNARKIAKYGSRDVKRLLSDAGIIRNRLKIAAAILNAQHFLEVQQEFGTFDKYIWQFVGGHPITNKIRSIRQIPATTSLSDKMSKDLKTRGFKFVGPTICYAFMQAVGMVNDHEVSCFRYNEVLRRALRRNACVVECNQELDHRPGHVGRGRSGLRCASFAGALPARRAFSRVHRSPHYDPSQARIRGSGPHAMRRFVG